MVLSLNTGSYVGTGRTYGYQGNGCGSSHVASSTKLNRISRDIATGYIADMEAIEAYLASGKTDKAIALYNELLLEVGATADEYGYELSDGQKASILTSAYQRATGETFATAVQSNTHGAFVTGLIEGIPLIGLFAEGTSAEEAMAKASGTKTELKDKVLEGAGAAVSNGAIGAGIGFAVGGPVGAAIGGGIGATVGILKSIFK